MLGQKRPAFGAANWLQQLLLLPAFWLPLLLLLLLASTPSNCDAQLTGDLAAEGMAAAPLPIVMWHGMGDSCCFPFSLGAIAKMLRRKLPGVYVHSLRIGGSLIADYESGFFIHPDRQVASVCRQLAANPLLRNGYNALGFSQGGQFLRAVAQRCPQPPMRKLVSFGGQHQGVFGLPNCPTLSGRACEELRRLLNRAAYTRVMQEHLVQATYWHDPFHEQRYREGSTFLADINNERHVNRTYVENLQRLERLILVMFSNDTIVQPRETEWFEFYAEGQDEEIVALTESRLYMENRLGLVELKEAGKLWFLVSEGNHLQFTEEWFDAYILRELQGN